MYFSLGINLVWLGSLFSLDRFCGLIKVNVVIVVVEKIMCFFSAMNDTSAQHVRLENLIRFTIYQLKPALLKFLFLY